MKKVWIYIQVILLLVFVGFLYGFAQYRSHAHKIEDVKVLFKETQPKYISVDKVKKLLLATNPDLLKKPIVEIDIHSLEKALENHKMLESVEVFVSPKNELFVEIVQRVPVCRISHGGKAYYIDRQGKQMPLSANYSARVPLVTGVSGEKQEKEVYDFVKLINKNTFYKKQIIGVHRKMNGDYLLSTRIGRHKVLLGKMEDVEEKLERLRVFYKKEWDSETLNSYKLINLKYNHQVVCSK